MMQAMTMIHRDKLSSLSCRQMIYNELVEIDRIYAHFRDEVTWEWEVL